MVIRGLCWFWLLVVSSFVFVLVLKVVGFLWWRPKRISEHFCKQGIKGPPYRFFLGNIKELVGLMVEASSKPMPLSHNILPRVFSFYHHWKKIYGATFLVWFGPTPRITVSDPDLIREIFCSKSEFYEKNESHPLVKQLEGDGLLSLKGEKWAHHRKIITPTFHMENLKMLVPVMGKSVVEMVDKWYEMAEFGDKEIEIEVSDWFQNLTEDVITRAAFGTSYEEGKAVFRLQTQQMMFAAEAFQKVLIPGYRFIPTKKNRSSWNLDKQIKKSLVKLIEQRRKAGSGCCQEEEENKEDHKDLLGLMIGAATKSNSPSMTMISTEDIVEECKSFFFAGKQTTSNLMTWTTILLAMHPDWQEVARDEILKVCGSRHIPTKDDIVKLKTLTMILNESLRLYPPAVATIRRAKADVDLGTYRILRGTELLVPIIAVHHDTQLWGHDATEFNPARFNQGVARAANHSMAFIPFGLGARTCVGQNLAILQAKLAIAIILQRFSFHLPSSYQHAPTVLMLLYPQYGAPIKFRCLN